MSIEVKLPDVGDNIEKGTIVAVLVKAGDSLSAGQPMIELETDKAVIEVPAEAEGTVEQVMVKEGDTLAVGAVILTLTEGAASSNGSTPAAGGGDQAASIENAAVAPQAEQAKEVAAAQQQSQKEQAQTAPTSASTPPASAGTQQAEQAAAPDPSRGIHAAPSVRRLAREKGIDLSQVQGSGIAGRISAQDLERPQATTQLPQGGSSVTLPDFSKWGDVRREDMSGIRKATVRSMTTSWSTIPMVTQFDKADITLMEETRKRFAERVEKAGGKLTMTHILMKVVANALRKFPKFNASLDVAAEQVVYKDYVNIGVAVDTPVGLLVPVLQHADRKSITDMVLELGELASRARERKLKPDEMQGATFTISNLGGIGGHAFTPIVNSPEVAILGVSRGNIEPVWDKESSSFVPRNMLPLHLTYDHRLIDGADAARFLRFICESLQDPFLISL